MLLAHLYNQPAAAHAYAETNGKIGALARTKSRQGLQEEERPASTRLSADQPDRSETQLRAF